MDEDVVTKSVLNLEREAIEQRVFRVPSRLINVVRGERNSLSKYLVVQHQDRAIEEFEFVVPQNVQYSGLGARGVPDQLGVVDQQLRQLQRDTSIVVLAAAKVEKTKIRGGVQLRAVDFVAANYLETYAFRTERHRQPECVMPVLASSQQTNLDSRP